MKRARNGLPSIEQLLQPIVDQFLAAIEAQVGAQTRAIVARSRREHVDGRRSQAVRAGDRPAKAAPAIAASAASASPARPATVKPKVRRKSPPRAQPRTPDPAYAERTAELNRLRSILRPAHEEPVAVLTTPSPPVAPPSEEPDRMKALEESIRDGIAFLSVLPPARCAAQIAVWAGRARLYQEDQVDGRARIAAGMLLEKLRGLARAMEIGRVDALDPSFGADWPAYVAASEAIATGAVAPAGADQRPAPVVASDEYGEVWR